MQHSPGLNQPQNTCLAVAEAWRNAVEAARWPKHHVLTDMVPDHEVFKKINYKSHSSEVPESAPRKAMRPCFPSDSMNLEIEILPLWWIFLVIFIQLNNEI